MGSNDTNIASINILSDTTEPKLDNIPIPTRIKSGAGSLSPVSLREFILTSQTGEAIETTDSPFTISIPYSVASPSVTTAKIMFLNKKDGKWIELETTVDTENNIATAEVSKLGIYRLVEVEFNPWDVKADGKVDISDLVLVASHLGETGENVVGDVNGDGVVDIIDLVLIGSHFDETCD